MLVFHVGVGAGVVGPQRGAGPYLQHLNVGVSVFFVLSAFLLYRPWVAARLADRPGPAVGRYLWRRALRILPAYWVALTVATYVLDPRSLGSGFQTLLYYGLGQIYTAPTALGGLAVAWSLCTEASFYVYLPIHAWVLRRWGGSFEAKLRLEYAACAVLYVASVAFKLWIRPDHGVTSTWLVSYLDTFALGMALAVATVAARQRERRGALSGLVADQPGRTLLAALVAYLVLANSGLPAGLFDPVRDLDYVGRQCTLGVIAVLVVAVAVLTPPGSGRVVRALASTPAVWLGRISFGVFLWHGPIIDRLQTDLRPEGATTLPFFVLLASVLLCTLAVAQLSWTLLERPLLRFRSWAPWQG